LSDENAFYFVAHSIASLGNLMDVCPVKRVLLVQAIYDGVKINLKKIWVDVPSWECRVLALKSTISD
jgi:hypothetical protein